MAIYYLGKGTEKEIAFKKKKKKYILFNGWVTTMAIYYLGKKENARFIMLEQVLKVLKHLRRQGTPMMAHKQPPDYRSPGGGRFHDLYGRVNILVIHYLCKKRLGLLKKCFDLL